MAPSMANYADIQQNEIDALCAIFMEDFEEQKSRVGAWNKAADRAFTLHLKPSSSSNADLKVKLGVTFPVTYPKTPPRLHIDYGNAVRAKPTKRIKDVINLTPSRLLGTEVVFAIATEIQDILEDAFQDLLTETPNLDQERAIHEASALQLTETAPNLPRNERSSTGTDLILTAQEQNVAVKNDNSDQKQYPDMTLEQAGSTKFNEMSAHCVDFHKSTESAGIESFQGSKVPFQKVFHRTPYGKGPATTVYTVLPEGSLGVPTNFLILKECMVKIPSIAVGRELEAVRRRQEVQKKAIQSLEDKLIQLMHAEKNEHIANVLNFRVQQIISSETGSLLHWNVSILVERATFGSLHDLMVTLKTLDIKIAKPWVLDIAAGIQWLHQHGLAHGRLHPRNVLFMSQADRPMKVKLCDGFFQDSLYRLNSNSRTDYNMARSTFWIANETLKSHDAEPQRSTDIWDLGVLMLQMLFGLDVQRDYESPDALINSINLSHSFQDLLSQIFVADHRKRLDAFSITLHRFFVVENAVYELLPKRLSHHRTGSASLEVYRKPSRDRHQSSDLDVGQSRYAQDFEQEMKLGKGGFGAVYVARNRLENRVYAIKKIVQSSISALEPILKEVRFLSQLNHPNVVRYYTAWTEGNSSGSKDVTAFSEDGNSESSNESMPSSQRHDTSGLDYISSSSRADLGYDYDEDEDDETTNTLSSARAAIQFGYDDEGRRAIEPAGKLLISNTSEEKPASTVPLPQLRRLSTAQGLGRTTLYIQMEYCKNKTLRDLITQDLHLQTQDCWRLFRQILEGLSHIHYHGIIHRDLKPENIFIDMSNNAKIGDYGLAANIEFQPPSHAALAAFATDTSLTQSIGTTIYVAPEVKSIGGGKYNQKADMYSLGVIFLEMCCPLKTGMERAIILGSLQKPDHTLPPFFQQSDKTLPGQVIELLVAADPADRPSGPELLQSGKLPVEMVDETIRLAIRGISDINDPNHKRFMSALFSSTTEETIAGQRQYKLPSFAQDQHDTLLQNLVKEQLVSIFRRHGAIENELPLLLPKSRLHDESAVPLLDDSGYLLQLPYDLTLPTATILATQAISARKAFTFGKVYRKDRQMGHPTYYNEVAFNIFSSDSLDLGLRQAEVLKVMDEILDAIPNLATAMICYHINHSRILDHILKSCEISKAKWGKVKNVLSKFDGFHYTWANIRTLLHSPDIGVSAASLDSLEQFNFRATHRETLFKLGVLLPDSAELEPTFSHLEAILQYLDRFQVNRPIYVNVLSCVNEKYYEKNFMFQCIMESKTRRDVLAAGGRFDELISRHRHDPRKDKAQHAVGFSLGWGSIVTMMARYLKRTRQTVQRGGETDRESLWAIRRCDVMVNSFEENSLRTIGLSLLSDLWANRISAELSIDASVDENFHHHQAPNRYGAHQHGWIASVKHDGMVKVRSISKKEEINLRVQEVTHFLRSEIQERDRIEAKSVDKSKPSKPMSLFNPGIAVHDRESNVVVITSQTKGKKTNRQSIIGDAQLHAHHLFQRFDDVPIVAIETSKEAFDGIHDTRLDDENSWRTFIQNSPISDRQYLADVQAQLKDLARTTMSDLRTAVVYNFRTKNCFHYDLGKAV